MIAATISQQLGLAAAPNGRRNDRIRRILKRLVIEKQVSRRGNTFSLKAPDQNA